MVLSIESLRDHLRSPSARERGSGLKSVQSLLRQGPKSEIYTPTNVPIILEGLQNLVQAESNTKTSAPSRKASEGAECIKDIIRQTAAQQPSEPYVNFANAIRDFLPNPIKSDERDFSSLANPYARSLIEILKHPIHLENFLKEDLIDLLRVISGYVESTLDIDDDEDSGLTHRNDSFSSAGFQSLPQYVADFLQSICFILGQSVLFEERVLNHTWKAVERYFYFSKERTNHEVALRTSILLFYHYLSIQSEQCSTVAVRVYKYLPDMWSTKSPILRELILVFLKISLPIMLENALSFDHASEEDKDLFYNSVEQLHTSMQSERPLKICEVELVSNITNNSTSEWFKTCSFQLKTDGNIASWMCTAAFYSVSYFYTLIRKSQYYMNRKRPRLASSSTSTRSASLELASDQEKTVIDKVMDLDIIDNLYSTPSTQVDNCIKHIQFFLFYLNESSIDDNSCDKIFTRLCEWVYEDNIELSAWSLLGINLLLQYIPQHSFPAKLLDDLWRLVFQRLHTPEFGPVGCQFIKLILTEKRYPPAEHKFRVQKVVSIFNTTGPKLNHSAAELVDQILVDASKFLPDKSNTRDSLILWAIHQIINTSPTQLEKYSRIKSQSAASMFLAMCEIKVQYSSESAEPCYYGNISAFQTLFKIHLNAEKYIYDSWEGQTKEKGVTQKQKSQGVLPLLPLDEIDRIMRLLKTTLVSLLDDAKLPETWRKFSATPVLLKCFIECLTSSALIISAILENYPDAKAQCMESFELVKSSFLWLETVVKTETLREDHITQLLLGAETFLDARNDLTKLDDLSGKYKSILGYLCNILSRTIEKEKISTDLDGSSKNSVTDFTFLGFRKFPTPDEVHSAYLNSTSLSIHTFQVYTRLQIMAQIQPQTTRACSDAIVEEMVHQLKSSNSHLTSFLRFNSFVELMEEKSFQLSKLDTFFKLLNLVELKFLNPDSPFWKAESTFILFFRFLRQYAPLWVSHKGELSNLFNYLLKGVETRKSDVNSEDRGVQLQYSKLSLFAKILSSAYDYNIGGENDMVLVHFSYTLHSSPIIQFAGSFLLSDFFSLIPRVNHYEMYRDWIRPLKKGRSHDNYTINIHLLFQVSIVSGAVLSLSLYDIVRAGLMQETYQRNSHLPKVALQKISDHYQFPKVRDLYLKLCRSILFHWVVDFNDNGEASTEDRLDILDFPFEMFGFRSLLKFLSQSLDVAIFLSFRLCGDFKERIEKLAAAAGVDIRGELKGKFQHFYVGNLLSSEMFQPMSNPLEPFLPWFTESEINHILTRGGKGPSIVFDAILDLDVYMLVDEDQSTLVSEKVLDVYKGFRPLFIAKLDQIYLESSSMSVILQTLGESLNDVKVEVESIPALYSIIFRLLIERTNESLCAVDRIINLRRIVFSVAWLNMTPNIYVLKFLLGSVISLLGDEELEEEASAVLTYLFDHNIHILMIDQVGAAIPLFLKIFEQFFDWKKTSFANGDTFTFKTQWFRFKASDYRGSYQNVIHLVLSWLTDQRVSHDQQGELLDFLTDDAVPNTAKTSLISIISSQMITDSNLIIFIFGSCDVKPVLKTLLEFAASDKASENYIHRVCQLAGNQCSIVGVDSVLKLFVTESTEIAAANEKDSLTLIFSKIRDLLDSEEINTGHVESALRSMIFFSHRESIHKDYHKILKKTLGTVLYDTLAYEHFNHAHTTPLPNTSFEDLALFLELPHRWLYNLEYHLIQRMESLAHGFRLLATPISEDEKFSSEIFSSLLHLYLSSLQNTKTDDALNAAIHLALLNDSTHAVIISAIADAYLYLRKVGYDSNINATKYLEVDYTALSKALLRVGLCKKAYMILELQWSRAHFDAGCFTLEDVETANNIYENINFPDMFYSRKEKYSIEESLKQFQHEQNYERLLQFGSASISGGLSLFNRSQISGTLQKYGFDGVSGIIMSSAPLEDEEQLYAYSWKLDRWDLPEVSVPSNKGEITYNLMKQHHDNYSSCENSFISAYSAAISLISDTAQTRDMLQTLQIVAECSEVYNATSTVQVAHVSSNLLSYGREVDSFQDSSFDDIEDILLARNLAWRFKEIAKWNSSMNLSNGPGTMTVASEGVGCGAESSALALSISRYCKLAREKNFLQKATNGVILLHNIYTDTELDSESESCQKILLCSQLENAQVLWLTGEKTSAINILRYLHEISFHPSLEIDWKLTIQSQLIEWFNDSGFDVASTVTKAYLLPAMENFQKSHLSSKVKADILHCLAEFCSARYQDKEKRARLELLVKQREVKTSQVMLMRGVAKGGDKLTNKELRAVNLGEKMIASDKGEIEEIEKTLGFFLTSSVKLYLDAAGMYDRNGEDIDKFMAVWFANISNKSLNSVLPQFFRRVPSIQFIPWINQLTSRLDAKVTPYQANLSSIVENVCRQHPYHGLYQLRSLFINFGDASQSQAEDVVSRAKGGEALWRTLLGDPKIQSSLISIDEFIINSIKVARAPISTSSKKQSLAQLSRLRHWWRRDLATLDIPSPTLHIEPRPTCDYSNVPKMAVAEDDVIIASGVSRPKIVTIMLSNGKSITMLMKGGNDDLRQDAIMEQVFEQMNVVFKKYKETRKRELAIRTYNVIPLGKTGGIIEFVKNTTPAGDYLNKAHARYFPGDMGEMEARKMIAGAVGESNERRVQVFKEIRQRIQPVMHMFFLERFFSSETWFASKARYIRSNAAISILGHVLGIGDRHLSNILFDTATGDVVHIDLGIAFDGGKWLTIPETVPFRLTHDWVDGMGLCGLAGMFSRCCNFTLTVLRDEVTSFDTILNVLRHDPLYNWTLRPMKARSKEYSSAEVNGFLENIVAVDGGEFDRVLGAVHKKLSRELTVETEVLNLISQATDPNNLALLFTGWAAFY